MVQLHSVGQFPILLRAEAKIKIEDDSNATTRVESSLFTIAGALDLTVPNGGEKLGYRDDTKYYLVYHAGNNA